MGALQGLNKVETVELHGEEEQVMAWRRGYASPPPPVVPATISTSTATTLCYADVPPQLLAARNRVPQADVVRRLVPYWEDAIAPHPVGRHTDVIVVAHGNSLPGRC